MQVARYYSRSRECRGETVKVFFMTIRKNSGVLRDLLLEKMNKKKRQQQQFRFVVCNRFVIPLSVRIMGLLYNAILWEILHIPLPKYGLSGVVVD